MDMVEAVARAICVGVGDDPDREGERLTAYDEAARAALKALAEHGPSEEMLQAAWDAHREQIGAGPAPLPRSRTDARQAYTALFTAMIHASLTNSGERDTLGEEDRNVG